VGAGLAPARVGAKPTPTLKRGPSRDRGAQSAPYILLLLLALTIPVHAEEIRGRIELLTRGGGGPARGSDVRQAVVYFEPAAPVRAKTEATAAAHAEPYRLVSRQKEFWPRVLAVPRGSRVQFANDDPILHNVFSVSGANVFDMGFFKKGPGKERTFESPGLVRVYCNVHQSMVAYVLVLDTPYFTAPGADGSFVLAGLPKTAGKVTVWHEQTEPWRAAVQLPLSGAAPLLARIEVTRPQIPPHLDKTGKSYFTPGRDRYGH